MKHKETTQPKPGDAPTSMVSAPGIKANEQEIQQPIEQEYSGAYRHRTDGYLYKHAVAEHPFGKTHKAMVPRQFAADGALIHTGLFWEGTKEEFRETFDKE